MSSPRRQRRESAETVVARLIMEAQDKLSDDDRPYDEVPTDMLIKPSAVVASARYLASVYLETSVAADADRARGQSPREARMSELALRYMRPRLLQSCWALWRIGDATGARPANDLLDFCVEQMAEYLDSMEHHRSNALDDDRLMQMALSAQQGLSATAALARSEYFMIPSRIGPDELDVSEWRREPEVEVPELFGPTVWFESPIPLVRGHRAINDASMEGIAEYCRRVMVSAGAEADPTAMSVSIDGVALLGRLEDAEHRAGRLYLRISHPRMGGESVGGTINDTLLAMFPDNCRLGRLVANAEKILCMGDWDDVTGACDGFRLSDTSAMEVGRSMLGNASLSMRFPGPV